MAPSREHSVISLTSSSGGSDHQTATVGSRNSNSRLDAVPAHSRTPMTPSQLGSKPAADRQEDHTSAAKPAASIPGLPGVRKGDMMTLAKCGYEILSEIAARLGFQESIAQAVYKHVGNMEQTTQVLRAMQKAAKRRGEKEIESLVPDVEADSDAGSGSESASGSGK